MGNLYPQTNGHIAKKDFYTINNGQRKNNIDLRNGMDRILFGDRISPPQGKTVLIRRMDEVCPCVLEERGQKERKPDPKCSVCQGEGYTFTDLPYTAWRAVVAPGSGSIVGTYQELVPGLASFMGYNFYFRWDTPIKDFDKLIEIPLNSDGTIPNNDFRSVNKLGQQYKKFKIVQLIIMRGDNARIEYIHVIAEEEQW